MNAPQKIPTSGLAVASLVFGILFCVPLAPLVGFILGLFALSQISKSRGALGGRGLAIAGIVLSGVTFVASIGILAAMAIPNFVRYQLRAKSMEARTVLSSIAVSEGAFFAQHGVYASAAPAGGGAGSAKGSWQAAPCAETCPAEPETCASFACIGFEPPGPVFYRYACQSTGAAVTCAAVADLDGDGRPGAYVLRVQSDDAGEPAPLPALEGLDECPEGADGQVVECSPGTH
jgi:type IV pilus assembly protein PilA